MSHTIKPILAQVSKTIVVFNYFRKDDVFFSVIFVLLSSFHFQNFNAEHIKYDFYSFIFLRALFLYHTHTHYRSFVRSLSPFSITLLCVRLHLCFHILHTSDCVLSIHIRHSVYPTVNKRNAIFVLLYFVLEKCIPMNMEQIF